MSAADQHSGANEVVICMALACLMASVFFCWQWVNAEQRAEDAVHEAFRTAAQSMECPR